VTFHVDRLLTRAHTRGVSEVGDLAITRVREWISSRDTLVMLVKEVSGRPERADDNVRPAGPGDALAYARDIGTESPRTFRARLDDATRCWLVTEGPRLIHASWTTSDAAWTRELRRWVRPPEGDVYIYESFTTAEARGRGAYPRALSGIASWAAHAGIQRLWVAVEGGNAASLRAVTKAGFVVGYEVGYRRRWGRLTVDPPTGAMANCGHNMVRAVRPATGSGPTT
jgi:hypothetical protein